VIGVRGFAFHDTIRAARRHRRAGAANAEWFVSKESIESVGTHTIGSVVPALAKNAGTGHPQFRSGKRRKKRIRRVGHPFYNPLGFLVHEVGDVLLRLRHGC
jgi:hypothetical protein